MIVQKDAEIRVDVGVRGEDEVSLHGLHCRMEAEQRDWVTGRAELVNRLDLDGDGW